MISSIILAVSLMFALVAIYKLGGDARHYMRMWQNEMDMFKMLVDDYRALEDKYHQAIKSAKIPDPGEPEKSASGPLLEEVYP